MIIKRIEVFSAILKQSEVSLLSDIQKYVSLRLNKSGGKITLTQKELEKHCGRKLTQLQINRALDPFYIYGAWTISPWQKTKEKGNFVHIS